MTTPSHHRKHRLALTIWLALCLLWQLPAAAVQWTAMASGFEVCTSNGLQRVGPDGKLVAAQHHTCPDSCCAASAALPRTGFQSDPVRVHWPVPAERPTMARLAAQWLAPLSRGPPTNV